MKTGRPKMPAKPKAGPKAPKMPVQAMQAPPMGLKKGGAVKKYLKGGKVKY